MKRLSCIRTLAAYIADISNALPKVCASLSSLILLLQPALAFVWDVLFFQRPTSIRNWVGLAVVLVAIYLGARRTKPVR